MTKPDVLTEHTLEEIEKWKKRFPDGRESSVGNQSTHISMIHHRKLPGRALTQRVGHHIG